MGQYSGYDDAWAKCPYYKGSAAVEVRCEGLECGQCIILRFQSGQRKTAHRKKYCNNVKGWLWCPMARMHEEGLVVEKGKR